MKVPNETYPDGAVLVWDVLSGVAKMAWDVMSGVTKTAWDVMSGVTKTAWDVLSGWQIFAGCFVRGVKKWHRMLTYLKEKLKLQAFSQMILLNRGWGKTGPAHSFPPLLFSNLSIYL